MLGRESLHGYQKTSVHHIIENTHCGLFLDMGMGKTVSTLTAFEYLAFRDLSIGNALVVGPKRVVESVWIQECEKWSHLKDIKCSLIAGTEKQRMIALNEKADIHLISRDNIAWLCGVYGGDKLPFDMLILDELSSFKNNNSVRFKALKMVQPHFKRIVGLTGTPAPNGLIDLWSQIYLLDRGERLERFITKYRQKYFNAIPMGRTGINKYKLANGGEDVIHNKIADICISMKSEDYLDIPGTQYIDIPVDLGEFAKKYEEFEKEKVLDLYEAEEDPSSYISVANAAALSNKLLQYANGAVYDEDKEWHHIHDKKIDALVDLVEQANGKPVLIAWSFKHDRDRIMKALKGHNPRELKNDKDVSDWNQKKIGALLMHPASGGHGLNLQYGGNIIIWFGMNWSLELYQQLNKRLPRPGQTEKVLNYRLISKGTTDEDVVNALNRKDGTQSALMEAVKSKIQKWTNMEL